MKATSKFIILICFLAIAYIVYDATNSSYGNNENLKSPVYRENDTIDNYIKTIEDVETIEDKKKKDPNEINCSILKVNLNNKIGFNISVGIPKKYSTSELVDLAKSISQNAGTVSDKGKVFFYLPEMPDGNGAWAVVNFNSTIDVEIIGKTLKDEKIIRENISNIKDYYGLWYDNFSKGVSVFRIRKDKNKGYVYEYVDPINPNEYENAWLLKKGLKNGKVIFYDIEHAEDKVYFEIEKNGDLTAYNIDGFICTYKKVK